MTTPAGSVPAAWHAVALEPPRAHGPPPARGVLKASPTDFVVEEELGFEPDGGAAHVLLRVTKTAANTLDVARALARHARVRPADVGCAGLKDRQAVATQWFSVPGTRADPGWPGLQGDGFTVLAALPHSRKLRRGALAGNRFLIRVRQTVGARADTERRLADIARRGVPNYFGAQRFGRDGSNLARAAGWLESGRLPARRDTRSFTLSAARALIFNAVLGARVRSGSWDRLLEGDVLNLDGTGSVFVAGGSAELEERVARGELHPTGPLAGRGGMASAAAAAVMEQAALTPFAGLVERLAAAGVDAKRRALRLRPRELRWTWQGDELELGFLLPRGAFATALLREAVEEA